MERGRFEPQPGDPYYEDVMAITGGQGVQEYMERIFELSDQIDAGLRPEPACLQPDFGHAAMLRDLRDPEPGGPWYEEMMEATAGQGGLARLAEAAIARGDAIAAGTAEAPSRMWDEDPVTELGDGDEGTDEASPPR